MDAWRSRAISALYEAWGITPSWIDPETRCALEQFYGFSFDLDELARDEERSGEILAHNEHLLGSGLF